MSSSLCDREVKRLAARQGLSLLPRLQATKGLECVHDAISGSRASSIRWTRSFSAAVAGFLAVEELERPVQPDLADPPPDVVPEDGRVSSFDGPFPADRRPVAERQARSRRRSSPPPESPPPGPFPSAGERPPPSGASRSPRSARTAWNSRSSPARIDGSFQPGRLRTRNPLVETVSFPSSPISSEDEPQPLHVHAGLRPRDRQLFPVRVARPVGVRLDLADDERRRREVPPHDERVDDEDRLGQHPASGDPDRRAAATIG